MRMPPWADNGIPQEFEVHGLPWLSGGRFHERENSARPASCLMGLLLHSAGGWLECGNRLIQVTAFAIRHELCPGEITLLATAPAVKQPQTYFKSMRSHVSDEIPLV